VEHKGWASGTPLVLCQLRQSTCFFLQEFSKLGLGTDTVVELRTLQLPVDYREAEKRVARLWEDFQPQVSDGWSGGRARWLMMWLGSGTMNFLDLALGRCLEYIMSPGPTNNVKP
jgi:hypothetical protein